MQAQLADALRVEAEEKRLCKTQGVGKHNLKGCNGINLTEKVVFWDCGIYCFLHCKKNSPFNGNFYDKIYSKIF